MTRLVALAFVGAAALAARAAVTNVVDVAALLAVADNAAETCANGWTLHSIGSYSDPVLQFNSKDDWILSPDFGAPILRIELSVRSSANATRLLTVFDAAAGGEIGVLAPCAAGNKDELQAVDISSGAVVLRFRLRINDSPGSANWGVGAIAVITADPVGAPTDLRVTRKGEDWCALAWVNGEGTVSNRVDATLVDRSAEGETVLYETGFDDFEGGDKANRKVSNEELAQWLGDSFSGANVYALAATNGICYLGQTRSFGILRFAGYADYSGIRLSMVAKRYSGDNADTTVAYELNGATNEVNGGTITLTDAFEEHVVDLSSVPDGAALLIGYYETKSNRRVLVDSLSIVRTGADVAAIVGSCWLPSLPGPASLSTLGVFDLAPRSDCRFAVCAQNADGILSESAIVEVRLGETPGARLILR